jgi:arylsulfatase A-like enzyme
MAEKLNVLVVVIEGARADHLSACGYRRPTTPFLEEVASEGVRFQQMISPAPASVSAHASLLTGRYPCAHGAHAENPRLGADQPVLPEILRAAGYRTAAFCTSRDVSPDSGFARGFEDFFTQRYQNRLADRAVSYGRRAGDRLLRRADAGGRRTNEAVREWLSGVDGPYFAFLHYDEPRLPLNPNIAPDAAFLDDEIASLRLRASAQDVEAYVAGVEHLTGLERRLLIAHYDSALRYVDHRLADVAMMLRDRGEWDRTLLVVTSDHGQAFGEHGLFGNRVGLHDELLRVPLLLRCPGLVPQGFVVEEIAQTVDIAPTVLALLGIAVPEPMQGRELFARGRVTPGPEFAVAERYRSDLSAVRRRFPDADLSRWETRSKVIRSRKEKLVWRSDENNEFFDLETDPGEEHNRIASDVSRADALRHALFDWFSTAIAAPATPRQAVGA